jgi:hypothetical protein
MDAPDNQGSSAVYRTRRRRPGLRLLAVLVALAVVVGAGVLVRDRTRVIPGTVQCEVDSTTGVVQLSPDQMANAATISAVGTSRSLPQRAITIALATAMQESHLENLPEGDRDSVGLFQQRPSQGWGTADQISDPVYATNRFFDALVQVPHYTRIPLTEAAQDVQHSAYPTAYAQHEADATTLSGALTGRDPAALSCQMNDVGSVTAGAVSASTGLQPGAEAVASGLRKEFGGTVRTRAVRSAGGTGSDGTGSGSGGSGASPSSAASEGLVLEAVPHGVSDDARQGWALAQWAVAHAAALHLSEVSWGGKTWSGDQSTKGWRADPSAGSSSVRMTVAAGKGAQAS